ncbi:alpha/beta fold hydrolase [Micromonospora sp. ATA32]|nr:alpha/beta fold hydrolase [Micromonospora sp. ATA32]
MVSVDQKKSTPVRLFSAPTAVRATFRVLEHAAPAVGARWAERIWFTLPRTRNTPAARPGQPAPGEAFALDVDGHRVVGEAWGEGPVVYLMHGWAGRREQLASFVTPLVATGHRVVAFDTPSHGRSAPGRYGPRSSSIPEFAAALTAVVARHGPAQAVIAHSMGATATAVALCDGLPVGRIALLAPMASPASHARQFAAMFNVAERTHRRLVARIERRVGAPMHHLDAPLLGRGVAMPPTLIVHDRDDTSVPVTEGEAIAATWTGARLHLTSGLGHRWLLRDPAVVAEVVDFVRR